MAFPVNARRVGSWLFPLLVALLVIGHACELPAFGDLIVAHHADADDRATTDHDHEGAEALTCDGALVVPGAGVPNGAPVVAAAVVFPAPADLARPAPSVSARAPRPATGPPLFLLFSSLLI